MASSSAPGYFCHACHTRQTSLAEGFKCMTCNSDFIEEVTEDSEASLQEEVRGSGANHEGQPPAYFPQLFLPPRNLFEALLSSGANPNRDGRGETRVAMIPLGASRSGPVGRQQRNGGDHEFFQEFISNLIGGEVGPNLFDAVPQNVFFGNPGDYVVGHEGVDAIVTHLLNQMEGTGPPPLNKEVISNIPVITVTQAHVDKNAQCSVCWESFDLSEEVRQLICNHIYHSPCIVPWLERHGTCPVCRKFQDPNNPDGDKCGETHTESQAEGHTTSGENPTPATSSAAEPSTSGERRQQSQSSQNATESRGDEGFRDFDVE